MHTSDGFMRESVSGIPESLSVADCRIALVQPIGCKSKDKRDHSFFSDVLAAKKLPSNRICVQS